MAKTLKEKNAMQFNKDARKRYTEKNLKYRTDCMKKTEIEEVEAYCEENNIPNVAYNVNTAVELKCENTAIISSKINWAPYFKLMIDSAVAGKAIPTDWCGGIKEGSVELTALNTKAAAEGTQAKLDEIKAQFEAGTLKVFDTNNFTVGGKKLDTYLADVVTDDAFTPDTEAIKDGAFAESSDRSAPYFDVIIDGITEI